LDDELRGPPAEVSFKSEPDPRVDFAAIDLDDTWDQRGKAVMTDTARPGGWSGRGVVVGPDIDKAQRRT
jgi:hypothetical protein